ncbi:MAG: c-type cytochrome biogenesis protein CcmI [Desulfobacterales bacterium]|nr:c-type cytochrome biogenesis protein CcmI [Desulfobacterales bacterium]
MRQRPTAGDSDAGPAICHRPLRRFRAAAAAGEAGDPGAMAGTAAAIDRRCSLPLPICGGASGRRRGRPAPESGRAPAARRLAESRWRSPMIWLFIASITAVVIGALLLPLFREVSARNSRQKQEITIFADQLAELQREVAAGLISADAAAATKLEIERRDLGEQRPRRKRGRKTGIRLPPSARE